jgi:hypothetical protein
MRLSPDQQHERQYGGCEMQHELREDGAGEPPVELREDDAGGVEGQLRAAGWEIGTDPIGLAPPPYRRAWASKHLDGVTVTVRSGWEETLRAALDRVWGMCSLVDGVMT